MLDFGLIETRVSVRREFLGCKVRGDEIRVGCKAQATTYYCM